MFRFKFCRIKTEDFKILSKSKNLINYKCLSYFSISLSTYFNFFIATLPHHLYAFPAIFLMRKWNEMKIGYVNLHMALATFEGKKEHKKPLNFFFTQNILKSDYFSTCNKKSKSDFFKVECQGRFSLWISKSTRST